MNHLLAFLIKSKTNSWFFSYLDIVWNIKKWSLAFILSTFYWSISQHRACTCGLRFKVMWPAMLTWQTGLTSGSLTYPAANWASWRTSWTSSPAFLPFQTDGLTWRTASKMRATSRSCWISSISVRTWRTGKGSTISIRSSRLSSCSTAPVFCR